MYASAALPSFATLATPAEHPLTASRPGSIFDALAVLDSVRAIEDFSTSLVHVRTTQAPFSHCMAAADAQTPSVPTNDVSFVGRRVGKYDIVRLIARGGMGTVYEAINTHIGKRVAMKFVDAELARNKDSVARFQREAEAASAVESGHIVTIFDSGFWETRRFSR